MLDFGLPMITDTTLLSSVLSKPTLTSHLKKKIIGITS